MKNYQFKFDDENNKWLFSGDAIEAATDTFQRLINNELRNAYEHQQKILQSDPTAAKPADIAVDYIEKFDYWLAILASHSQKDLTLFKQEIKEHLANNLDDILPNSGLKKEDKTALINFIIEPNVDLKSIFTNPTNLQQFVAAQTDEDSIKAIESLAKNVFSQSDDGDSLSTKLATTNEKYLADTIEGQKKSWIQELKGLFFVLKTMSSAGEKVDGALDVIAGFIKDDGTIENTKENINNYNQALASLVEIVNENTYNPSLSLTEGKEGINSIAFTPAPGGQNDIIFIDKEGYAVSTQITVDESGSIEGTSLIRHPLTGAVITSTISYNEDTKSFYFDQEKTSNLHSQLKAKQSTDDLADELDSIDNKVFYKQNANTDTETDKVISAYKYFYKLAFKLKNEILDSTEEIEEKTKKLESLHYNLTPSRFKNLKKFEEYSSFDKSEFNAQWEVISGHDHNSPNSPLREKINDVFKPYRNEILNQPTVSFKKDDATHKVKYSELVTRYYMAERLNDDEQIQKIVDEATNYFNEISTDPKIRDIRDILTSQKVTQKSAESSAALTFAYNINEIIKSDSSKRREIASFLNKEDNFDVTADLGIQANNLKADALELKKPSTISVGELEISEEQGGALTYLKESRQYNDDDIQAIIKTKTFFFFNVTSSTGRNNKAIMSRLKDGKNIINGDMERIILQLYRHVYKIHQGLANFGKNINVTDIAIDMYIESFFATQTNNKYENTPQNYAIIRDAIKSILPHALTVLEKDIGELKNSKSPNKDEVFTVVINEMSKLETNFSYNRKYFLELVEKLVEKMEEIGTADPAHLSCDDNQTLCSSLKRLINYIESNKDKFQVLTKAAKTFDQTKNNVENMVLEENGWQHLLKLQDAYNKLDLLNLPQSMSDLYKEDRQLLLRAVEYHFTSQEILNLEGSINDFLSPELFSLNRDAFSLVSGKIGEVTGASSICSDAQKKAEEKAESENIPVFNYNDYFEYRSEEQGSISNLTLSLLIHKKSDENTLVSIVKAAIDNDDEELIETYSKYFAAKGLNKEAEALKRRFNEQSATNSDDKDPRNQIQDDAKFESDKEFLMREDGRDFINNITPEAKALSGYDDDLLLRAMLLHNPSKIRVIYDSQVLHEATHKDVLLGKVEEISDDGNEEIKEALTSLIRHYYGKDNSALKYFIRQLSSENIHDILPEYHRHRDYISSYKGDEADLDEEFRVLKEFDRHLNDAQTYNQAAKNKKLKTDRSSQSTSPKSVSFSH